jgi:hypothetical protein
MGLMDYLWFVKGLYGALTACLDCKSSFTGRKHDSQTVRRPGWLRTGTFYSKNACPQGSEYEYSATDFVWCSRSKYIDFSPRSLNRTKIAYRYTIYIKIMRRPKSWRFSASFTDFLATLTHMTRALHGRARI